MKIYLMINNLMTLIMHHKSEHFLYYIGQSRKYLISWEVRMTLCGMVGVYIFGLKYVIVYMSKFLTLIWLGGIK